MMKSIAKTLCITMLLIIVMVGVASAAPQYIDNSKHSIDGNHFNKNNNGIKFDKDINNAKNFEVTKDRNSGKVHISLKDESAEATTQTIGVPLSDLNGFKEFVVVTHYNDNGISDYSQVVKPAIIDDVAYVDVEFTEVTITPLISQLQNWNFENWTGSTTTPDNWTVDAGTGSFRSTDSRSGTYAYGIVGGGQPLAYGSIHQNVANLSNGSYYTIGAWIKGSAGGTGCLNIDLYGGSVDSYGIRYTDSSSSWQWVEYREQINTSSAMLRIFADGSPTRTFLVDNVMLSPDYHFAASESNDSSHAYQSFSYTPSAVYNNSIFMTQFETYNLSSCINPVVITTIDGKTKTSYITGNNIYIDTSGLSVAKHNVQVVVSFTPKTYPVAIFTANVTTREVPFTASFTDASTGSPTVWLWNFGDGGTSTSQNPTHTYTTAGTYTVSLTATNANGTDVETKSGYIKATSSIPVAGFDMTTTRVGTIPHTVQFEDTSAGAEPKTYLWDFGDGTTSTDKNPMHTYEQPGTFNVTLTITNAYGTATNSKQGYVTVGLPESMNNTSRNYSQYVHVLFTDNMTGWDFVSNTKNVYTSVMPEWFFWLIILVIPYIGMYTRQGGIEIIAVIYLFTGAMLATVMPAILAPFAKWFIIFGAAGIFYKIFINE